MDSCVTAAIAQQKYILCMLHLNYGQRTQKREEQAFQDISDYYTIPRERKLIVSVDYLNQIGGSSLTDLNIRVTSPNLASHDIPSSYVPFRNANILAMAVSWAEVIGAKKVFIGAVEEDSSGYPDCRKTFFHAFNTMISLGTKPQSSISIETPLIDLTKAEIVKKGNQLNAPLHLTWSCYQNSEKACGDCDSCALRLRGFEMAGFEDTIPYEKKPTYR